MTVLNRLYEKKMLLREKVGLQYVYWLPPKTEQIPPIFEQLKKRLFGIKATEMVNYLVSNVSDEELAEMERIIQKAKEENKKR